MAKLSVLIAAFLSFTASCACLAGTALFRAPAAAPRATQPAVAHAPHHLQHQAHHQPHRPAYHAPRFAPQVRYVPVAVPVVIAAPRVVAYPVRSYPVAATPFMVPPPAPVYQGYAGAAPTAGGTITFSPSDPPAQNWGWSRVDSVATLVRRSMRDYCPDYDKFYPEVETCPSLWVRTDL